MFDPCVDHCFLRYGKQYSSECDTTCEYAKMSKDLERMTAERDEAANCIYGVKTALENGDRGAAMEELITYEYRLTKV